MDGRLRTRRVDGDVDLLAVVGLELGSVLTFSYVDLCFVIARTTTKVNVDLRSVLFMFGSEKKRRKSVDGNTKAVAVTMSTTPGPRTSKVTSPLDPFSPRPETGHHIGPVCEIRGLQCMGKWEKAKKETQYSLTCARL